MRYDIIGDIHGHVGPLESLLGKLGYRKRSGIYRLDGHTAVFLGDFIDRGPAIRQTLSIVRSMVDYGSALAVMGNHEFNAVCFNTSRPGEPHRPLRSRTDRHIRQHIETLREFRRYAAEWREYLAWFRRLPLFLDLGTIRAVHAAWHEPSLDILRRYSDSGNILTDELLFAATRRGSPEFNAIQNVIKGVEIDLPGAATFVDKDGNERREMRVRWWLDASASTYGDIVIPSRLDLAALPVSAGDAVRFGGYRDRAPVFVGHYWLEEKKPAILSPKVACLDYSVARGGFLVAYRWEGEEILVNDHFVCHE